jgi:membrane peptidoglycan carboxypeptidase
MILRFFQAEAENWYNKRTMEINFTRLFENLQRVWQSLSRKLRILIIRFSHNRRRYAHLSPGQQELIKAQRMRLLARGAVGAVIFGIVMFFLLFAWYSRELPRPGEVIRREGFSTKLYDRDGELLYDLYNTERRTPITLEDTPAYLEQATVAIEDRDFYRHGGFDFLTVLRIPYNILFRGRVIGGSTLTQQLVDQ